jgi:non-specific serine/threonine protein kinase
MSKVYSNKALPPGTVLREWRLEEVLGVGGFGIVYKARGIYFDELVAIKEYFPSSISERQDDDTIVPVDSAAEEVHALGLKKFVEEAKLLWNLSTPSRHPNIVSVRSLFEIHGSAYMVMDFEDGASLSRLLKEGRRFNQASLTALIRPIAEGLERAHRVGVLHRDIKPPNILVGLDGRPVLIDFGSARFDSGDATSTSVTFHTPPYAAIEQYVKTYQQGPWTDIYALGVVLYECVAGEKPAEVLERLHGNADRKLSDGDWPGFSRSFLAAIDAAMTIRPDDRPSSISEWLALFDRPDAEPAAPAPSDDDDDRTRITTFTASADQIRPVAPPAPGFETKAEIRTSVPDTPSKAEFTSAGMATRGVRLDAKAAAPSAAPEPVPVVAPPATAMQVPPKAKPLGLYAGVAAAVVALGVGGWYVLGAGSADTASTAPATAPANKGDTAATGAGQALPAGTLGTDIAALAADAAQAGIPAAATTSLAAAATSIAALETDRAPQAQIDAAARPALLGFASVVADDVSAKARRAGRQMPWIDARRSGSAATATAQQRQIAATLLDAQTRVASARAGIAQAATGAAALALAQQALTAARTHATTLADARRLAAAIAAAAAAQTTSTPQRRQDLAVASNNPQAPAEKPGPGTGVSAQTRQEFQTVVASARDVAREVIRLGDRARPGARASELEQTGFRLRQQNAQSAKTYQDYLDTLSRSMEGTTTEAVARQSVDKARQTLSYLNRMQAGSKASLP